MTTQANRGVTYRTEERDVWTVPAFAPYSTCVECYALVLSVHVDRHYEAAHPGVKL